MLKATNLLSDRYKHNRYIPSDDDDWPPYHPKHYTPLTIVHHEGRCTESEVTAGVQAMKTAGITEEGKSCCHFHDKTAKPINDLLAPFEGLTCPYMILIEGVPGIGKTIMSKEIASQWAKKKLLKTKKMLFLLFLRDPMVRNITEVPSLVKYFCQTESLANKVTDWLIETGGEYLTIVLDGYDEMCKENQGHCIVDSIINRQILPKCSIIITSRPGFSLRLHDNVSCRAEILGFSRKDQQNFIHNALKGKHDRIKGLIGFLQTNPSINALCCIPLNMSILLCLATEGISALPKSQTRLYQKFIFMTIVHFLKKDKIVDNTTITSLDNLPCPYDQIYRELSQFAFVALQKAQIVFTSAELQSQYPNLNPANWGSLGLLKRAQYFKPQDGYDHESFHFLHYSIQEYMAACYIASFSDDKLLQLLKETFWNVHYFNTWFMYVGITGGKKFIFMHFLSGNHFQTSSRLFGTQKISNAIMSDKLKCLHLLQCSTEAEHEMLSSVQNMFQDGIIDLSNQLLSIYDVRALAELLLRLPRKKWKKLDLSSCGIDNEACNLFCELVLSNNNVALQVTTVDISDNQFHWESLTQLSQVLKQWEVNELIMSYEVLHDSTTVKLVNQFKETLEMKLLKVGHVCLPSLENVLVTYLPEKNKMIAVYTCCSCAAWCACTLNCCLLNDCQLNDKSANSIFSFILHNRVSKDYLPLVNVRFDIPSDLANEKLSIISSCVHHIIFKGLRMHANRIYMLNHFSVVIIADKGSPNFIADLVMAIIVHSHYQSNEPYLKAIPVDFAEYVKESLQDFSGVRHICACSTNLDSKAAIDLATVLSYNTNLTELCLGGNNLQSTGAIKIAQALQKISTLSSLVLGDNIGKEAADHIASALYRNTKLKVLALNKNNFQTGGAITIVKALQNTSILIAFGLADNNINEEAADDIANVLCHNSELQVLQLGGNNLQAIGIMKIAKALQNTAILTKFDVAGNNVSEEAADDIANVLCHNTELEVLQLGGNNLQATGIMKIAKALQNTATLTEFDIVGNNVSEEAADDIAAVLSHNNKLQELNLSGNNLKATGIITIAKALENNPSTCTLTNIDISNNNIGMDETAAAKLAAILYHCHDLRELKLSGNNLQGTSTIKITRSLQKLPWLRIINFSSNNIDAEAADDIAAALSHKSILRKLDLSGNNLQTVGIIKISRALWSISNLVELNISSNGINDEAAGDIAAALFHNNKLVKLDLHHNELQAAGIIRIAEELKNITTLEVLDISDNSISKEAIDDIVASLSHISRLEITS